MASVIWLAVFLVVLLAAALTFLYLHAMRQMREQAAASQEMLAKLAEASVLQGKLAMETAESMSAESRSQISELSEALQETTTTLLTTTQQALDLSLTRALDGSNRSTERMATLLSTATTLLGTKDPIAFQQVRGADFTPGDPSVPYPAMDEADNERVLAEQQANIAKLDEAAALLANFGVTGDSDAGRIAGAYSFNPAE